MNEAEFQKIVLEKLTSMGEGQARLEGNQVRLEEGQARLEGNQVRLEEGQARLENKIDHLASDSQKDILAMLKLMDAKLDNTASKEDIARIEDVLDVLAARSTRQEAEILNLKRAK